ncbi:DUF3408 domain-containing protein [Bacteroides thetaiotaomicron]|uniref:DUF3408 domain-containing protein n=1 Tax=Bacteroides thetaiotaomicron TaxID=818 RepID=UPI0018A99561|nr:DUF3408 domain-containing protein [Bacteroides thetaiotaomicron]MDC2164113.1 DUF3408 domain-containing protein [Bacteroides thetaiotaomicron]
MAKKTSRQNPVDEAYLRSLMAGVPSETPLSSAPSTSGGDGEKRETTLSDEKRKADDNADETVRDVSGTDDTGCSETVTEKPSPKTIRTALADFIRKYLTPYKCEGRQGVYIDKELHQKISVIVGIAGKRQLTVGNYIDNVLKEHFEKHADEVKTYLQKSYNKIF